MLRISFIFIVSFLCASGMSADPGVTQKADALTEEGKIDECGRLLQGALPSAANALDRAEILWRLARTTLIAAQEKKQRNAPQAELVADYERGAAYATAALENNPSSYMAYFWRASNWGSWAQEKQNLEALGKVDLLRNDLVMALRLKNDFALGYFVLGMIYGFLPGWPLSFGNRDYAVSLVRRAVAVAEKPEEALGYSITLASLLWDRNWDANARRDRRVGMLKEYESRFDPADRYCFYEGALDFAAVPVYGSVPLARMTDREEARKILDYAEALLPQTVKDAAALEQSRKTIRELRAKWK